ncbi:glycosyltransferase [Salsipaludibacter albus]|uniref:glycosyltransferase n=1 Tax=Salsipaludibacter albus TaxID=2849650 RepID=UPI001EE45B2B|nr:glycosyltransferase [Salsipaludibacter albus]MBY5163555.1 glycosyltransferase [Salsipaludibacter albus]
MPDLTTIAARSTDDVDLTDPTAVSQTRVIAEQLLDTGASRSVLQDLARDPDVGIDVRVATKLAESRRLVDALPDPLPRVQVQFAMWGEHRRLRPRAPDNPAGEDSLRVKLDQLGWLLDDRGLDWRLVAVDDGSPDDDASVAREMAHMHPLGERVVVAELADAIPTDEGPLAGLGDVDASRKGGAMVLGAQLALDDGMDAAVLTDADNSVDLGQLGLLLAPFVAGVPVVVGDRKHPDAVLRKAEARWGPGIVVLRHMQRMVGRALFSRGLRDTQAAFKLFGRDALVDILAAPSTYGFSFDPDWLYGALASGHEIATTPFAFVDSFAESASLTQGPMTTWQSLLVGLTASARSRGADHDEDMAALVSDHASVADLERIVARAPAVLAQADPARLGDPELMSVADLRAWIEDLLATEPDDQPGPVAGALPGNP